jgi:methanogenic corrinoid protein MtbC1
VPSADLLSIGDLAAASGIPVGTIRAWGLRYGVPAAERLPSGHRRYRAAQVRWLRRVAEAIASGHRTSEVVRLSEARLDALLQGVGGADDAYSPAPWLALARRYAGRRLVERLRASLRQLGLVPFLDQRVAPFLEGLGRDWADGKISIRHEHWASQIVDDFLRAVRRGLRSRRAGRRRSGVLAALSGERHALGLQMAACVCAQRGFGVRLLGADCPLEEIAAAAREVRAAFVAVSVSLATGGLETDRSVGALRALLPERVRLVVGGGGARGPRRPPKGAETVISMEAFDAWLGGLPA